MDAARAAMGQGWPFAAGPWSNDGTKGVSRSETRMPGVLSLWLLSLCTSKEKVTRRKGEMYGYGAIRSHENESALFSPMEPKFVNPTFRGAEPSWANACVGENGEPDAIDYARGFSAAANLLIERVIEDEGIHNYVDEFIYPICFNMRHSVELRLKNSIETLAEVAEHLGQPFIFNHAGSHDIGNIWRFFKSKSEALDKRYLQINNKINPTITDIAEIDATGQVFRYPTSNENVKHLVEVSIINVIILRDAFRELELNLNLLHRLSKWLSREYSLGTYTEKLSRPMLYEVAKMLPPKSTWASPEFDIAKDRIKNELDLSSRDFSKAINKIKEQHQLASIIESPIPLYGLNEFDLHEFCELWFKTNKSLISSNYNDARIEISNLANPALMDEMINDFKNDLEAWKIAQDNLTIEKLAGLKALFYFARERDFVEHYQTIYNGYLVEFKNLEISKLKEPFLHLHRKSNAIENILQSLYLLGYTSTAEAVVETYKLERAFSWLQRARARQLYKYPDFAGYSAL